MVAWAFAILPHKIKFKTFDKKCKVSSEFSTLFGADAKYLKEYMFLILYSFFFSNTGIGAMKVVHLLCTFFPLTEYSNHFFSTVRYCKEILFNAEEMVFLSVLIKNYNK